MWAFSSKELLIFLGYGGDDHERLTEKAITNISLTYGDIQKFSSTIKEAASNEGITGIGAHDDPLDATQLCYWSGNEDQWAHQILPNYLEFKFDEAYKRLGFVIHLIQDFQVPAHQKIIFHGSAGCYRQSPGTPTVICGSSHRDNFELFSSNNHENSISDITILIKYFLTQRQDVSLSFGYLILKMGMLVPLV